ncbi:MAG: hybrid sensor histidine kinase/response regulator [Phototrophicaceae bacterium]
MEFQDHPASVLVVDDNEMNIELLENILDRYNYHVYTATRGSTALEIAQEHLPDIVLLDINMPGMNGYEVCRAIKENARTTEIPVIFISALEETDDIVRGFDAGAVDYITKPFKYREVIARIQTQMTLAQQKREIQALRQHEKQLYQNMDDLRSQFIGSATHDLKNPLFVISGYADILEANPIIKADEQVLGFVHSIQNGVNKMRNLVHDILELLQLETEVTLEKMPVEFTKFVAYIGNDLRLKAQEKNITLDVYPPDEDAIIYVDPQRISRVFDNLVSNAIKYTANGGRVEVIGKVGYSTVVVEVIDNGLGIPEEALATLFQPFKRVNTEEHMRQEGTGLGLSIVKTLLEQHDGTIELDTKLGEGSCFRVTLPM